jgi:glucose/mannose-6-phosphate isomerase
MLSNQGFKNGTARMYELVHALPDQIIASAGLAGLDDIQPLAAGCRRIILCGMGGSAIAGDLVQPLLGPSGIQLHVWRDYGLPGWAAADDLVICSSYSGNTEESLSGARAAGELGCARLAITSGGELAALAGAEDFPKVILPPGLPPRASLGLGLGALTRSLGRLGVIPDSETELAGAVDTLAEFRAARLSPVDTGGEIGPVVSEDPEGNITPAELARLLMGRTAVIYTAGAEAHAAGLRLKAQLNENSKVPACLAQFPELDHNDLVGWDLDPADRGRFILLILRGMSDNERVDRRVDLTRSLLADEFPEIHEIRTEAPGCLGRIMSLVQYGDFLSCHLARLRQVDPLPVERIIRLKEALGKPE